MGTESLLVDDRVVLVDWAGHSFDACETCGKGGPLDIVAANVVRDGQSYLTVVSVLCKKCFDRDPATAVSYQVEAIVVPTASD